MKESSFEVKSIGAMSNDKHVRPNSASRSGSPLNLGSFALQPPTLITDRSTFQDVGFLLAVMADHEKLLSIIIYNNFRTLNFHVWRQLWRVGHGGATNTENHKSALTCVIRSMASLFGTTRS